MKAAWPSSLFFQPKPKTSQERIAAYCGHIYRTITSGIHKITELTSVTEGVQYLCRSGLHIASMLNPERLGKPGITLRDADNYVGAVRIFYDAAYFSGHRLHKDIMNKEWDRISANIAFTGSDLCSLLSFVHCLQLVDTANWAAAIGSFSIYGLQPVGLLVHVSLSQAGTAISMIGYLFVARDSLMRIHAGDHTQLTVAYLARAVAELAYKILLLSAGTFLSGTTGVLVVAGFGLIASSLATRCVYLQIQGMQQQPRYRLKR